MMLSRDALAAAAETALDAEEFLEPPTTAAELVGGDTPAGVVGVPADAPPPGAALEPAQFPSGRRDGARLQNDHPDHQTPKRHRGPVMT